MYKTREDIEQMIIFGEWINLKLRQFGMWVLTSVSSPTPGVVFTEQIDHEEDKSIDSGL